MNLNIFNGLPAYVRITILSQIRRLLSTHLFSSEDKEDIAQDLLLFYLKRFYEVPDPDEALVVYALKQYATNLLVKKYRCRDFLCSSLADFDADEEFSFGASTVTNYGASILINELMQFATDKERKILYLIAAGYSINQISASLHIHKRVVRRLFEKIRKYLK